MGPKRNLWHKLVGVVLGVVVALMVLAPMASADGSLDDPVKTDAGLVSGLVVDDGSIPVHAYLGVPYAAPPVGDLRWKAPQPVEPWEGVLECTAFGLAAAQAPGYGIGDMAEASEDCLNLNIYTPAGRDSERRPVMVWFHPGGLDFGSGNDASCNTLVLPERGVVQVNVNHRVGLMGYLALPELSAESAKGVSGNYGLLDLIASLKWIKKNISSFGGDPNRVTIFGESGGGDKVLSMMASPMAKGLFDGAIVQSGIYGDETAMFPVSEPLEALEEEGRGLVEALGISGETDVLSTLRSMSWEELVTTYYTQVVNEKGDFPSRIAIDGWLFPDTLPRIFKAGRQQDVPIIIGANGGEDALYQPITDYLNWMNRANVKRARHAAPSRASRADGRDWRARRCAPCGPETRRKIKSAGYTYVFNQMPSNWRAEGAVPPHGLDNFYLFGNLEGLPYFVYWFPFVTSIYSSPGAPRVWPENPDPGLDESDYQTADNMQSLWVQFAATGRPSIPGRVQWPAFKRARPRYLSIAGDLEVAPWSSSAFAPAE